MLMRIPGSCVHVVCEQGVYAVAGSTHVAGVDTWDSDERAGGAAA